MDKWTPVPDPEEAQHDVGWLTRGWWRRERRMLCQTCGATGRWHRRLGRVWLDVELHLAATRPNRWAR